MARTFLTFDLGTTLFKVALFDEQGRIVALHHVAPPIHHPRPDWCELDTDDFKRILTEAVSKLRFDAGAHWDDIVACSFATQANSFTLLDVEDRPLLPLILWPDRRAAELEDELRQVSHFGSHSGVPRLSIHLAIAKHRW